MKKFFSLLALLLMTMASWAEEQTPNYLTLTVNEGSATVRTNVHFAYDGEGTPDSYGVPSRDFPLIMFSINDGEWFSPQGEFQYLYRDELGYFAGYFKNEPQLKKGDVLRIKGNNETLASFATGDVWLSFINCSEDFSLSHSGNASSLFDGGGYASKEPDINAFMGNAFDFMNIVGCVTNDGATTWYDDAKAFMDAVNDTYDGEMSVKLLADCDLGGNTLSFMTTTTFDLNGYTLTGFIQINAPSTINDSSKGKTGKVKGSDNAVTVFATTTINGGTFEGHDCLALSNTLYFNGGTCCAVGETGHSIIEAGGKLVIPDGYEYTDGKGKSISGTLTGFETVSFFGSIKEKAPIAEVTLYGTTNQYTDMKMFAQTVSFIEEGEMTVKLLADCDLENGGGVCLEFKTTTTLDLNGYTLKGFLNIIAPSTINDSSEGKTGKVERNSSLYTVYAKANLTINGGTFEGGSSIYMNYPVTVTLNGGKYSADEQGAFVFNDEDAKLVIADGYEYTDGNGNSVSGTLTKASDKVTFAGSVQKITATPTNSRRVELDHVGAYSFKTIENGQIVIFQNGEKYNLAGQKIK